MSFEELVRELDGDALESLRQSVAAEIEGRDAPVRVEDIHPRMTESQKQRATREISKVLRDLYA